jgi:hypothetical protein
MHFKCRISILKDHLLKKALFQIHFLIFIPGIAFHVLISYITSKHIPDRRMGDSFISVPNLATTICARRVVSFGNYFTSQKTLMAHLLFTHWLIFIFFYLKHSLLTTGRWRWRRLIIITGKIFAYKYWLWLIESWMYCQ